MSRYVWEDHKHAEHKDIKQTPLTKNDDFPTLFKYLANLLPEFGSLDETVLAGHHKNRDVNDGYKRSQ